MIVSKTLSLLAPFAGLSFSAPPGGYDRLTGAFNPAHVVDTFPFFNSWLGIASPASPFDTEYGSNLYFGVRVEGFGAGGATSFALNDFVFMDNSYTGGTPNSIFFNTAGDSNDGLFILGVQSGPDGAPGGGDDIFLQSGEDRNIAVNALFYRGYSVSFPFSAGSGTNQEQLDSYIASVLAATGALPPQMRCSQH